MSKEGNNMATLVSIPIPKKEFHLSGNGHDINRVKVACEEKLRQMEKHRKDPTELTFVTVPEEDDTL